MSGYVLEGAKWATDNVTWSFANSTLSADSADPFSSAITGAYQSAIQWALQQWASVSGLQFTQVADSSSADIRIGFADLNTSSTGIIGQTSLQWDGSDDFVSDQVVRIEDPSQLGLTATSDGNFSYNGTQATLRQIAMHEIGHALGLAHPGDSNAVMYAVATSSNQTLDSTDIAGIQSLYGAPASTAATPSPTPATATSTSSPGGSDTLVLYLSEDAWQGDAQFTVSVDGQQVGGANSVTASHSAGQSETFTFQGNFGSGSHTVGISFINDAYGGSPSMDRNLYVDGLSYDGSSPGSDTATLDSNGTDYFTTGGTTTPTSSAGGSDTIVLDMSEDAWLGDAQFTVSVDGQQVGGTYTATASHSQGQTQAFTLQGSFGAGAHDLAVSFINDAYGGSPSTDRNLYVDRVSFDGTTVSNGSAALYTNSTAHFQVGGSANATVDTDNELTKLVTYYQTA